MKPHLTRALAAGVLTMALVPAPASAGAPVGGCPTGAWWRLILPVHQPQPADHNGDTFLCRLDLPDGSFTFRDNTVREP